MTMTVSVLQPSRTRSVAAFLFMLLFLTGAGTGAHAHHQAAGQPHNDQERSIQDVGRQAFDATILRPLGLIQNLASAAMFVVFYPAALATDTVDELTDICITLPVEHTFERPLGKL